jgi:hypothetical protein
MKSYRAIGMVIVASLACVVGSAQADMLANGNFDTGILGWTSYGAEIGRNDGTEANHSPDGANLWLRQGWLVGDSATPLVSLVEGQTYKFSFLAALLWDTTSGGTTVADIEHRTLHADLQVKNGSYVEINQELTQANTPADWRECSVTFTATSADVGKTYAAEFLASYGAWTGHTNGTGDCYFGIDSVRLSAVPEPTTSALLATGLLGLMAYAWRKRK